MMGLQTSYEHELMPMQLSRYSFVNNGQSQRFLSVCSVCFVLDAVPCILRYCRIMIFNWALRRFL